MKYSYKIELLEFGTISVLPNAWGPDGYRELLQAMDYEDTANTSDADLKELCGMALTDNEPDEAAAIVLGIMFKDQLKPGQVQNMSHEMLQERLWEEYSDLSLHEPLFNAHQLLFEAFQKGFPKPEALRFRIRVSSDQARGLQSLKAAPEAGLIRLLAQGMPENTKINRLYEEELKGGDFGDANHILWQLHLMEETANALLFEGISSHYWFRDLKHIGELEAELLWE